jgi:hypothetical protein
MELQMKQLIAIFAITIFATNSVAQDWKDPNSRFDARRKMSDTIRLTWRTVDDVQKACEDESRRRGNGGFGYSVEACGFWSLDGTECTIITRNRSTMHELGHEVRHCFQGNYH